MHPGYPWDLLRTKRDDCVYVAISKERQQTLAGLFECPIDEIKLVYNGVDPYQLLGLTEQGMKLVNRLGLMKSDLNLLMPVRVTQAKNIEFALKVVAELKMMGLKPKLVLTGPPDPHDAKSMNYFQSLRDLREKFGVRDEMSFVFEVGPEIGKPFFINEQVVGDLYRVSDVMFMPSHREGFGMPVLEAGLVGVPVISREVPAAQEIADKEAVIFHPDDSAEKIATSIVKMLDESETARLRNRVRRHFTWKAIFENCIQPLMQSGGQN